MTYIMNKSKSYIVGFCITLIFILIMLHHNSNSSSPALVYTQTYVDSLRYEIQLRDSLITDFKTYIPIGSPLDSTKVNSKYGWRWGRMHQGVDLRGRYRDTVFSTAAGIVVESGWSGGYGKRVKISHNNGYQTVYAHLSKIFVKKGEVVQDSTAIGKVGNTGFSTGCHLHYEIIKDGEKINPEDLLYKEIDM